MTLDKRSDTIKREDNIITLCVRNDKEKKKTALDEDLLKSQLIEQGYKLNISDTHIGKSRMSMDERKTELQKIWDTFSKSKLVITDRLHGMIFAYITGTPALVLPNSNFKVEKCYEWIKDCGYVEFIKEPTNEAILSRLGIKFSEDGFESTYSLINDKMKVNII
jgi:pyruvyl transferase EpsI